MRFVCALILMFTSFVSWTQRRDVDGFEGWSSSRHRLKVGVVCCRDSYVDSELLAQQIAEAVSLVEKVDNIRVINNFIVPDSLSFSVQLVDGSIHHGIECDVRMPPGFFHLKNCGNDEVRFQEDDLQFSRLDIGHHYIDSVL